MKSKRYQERQNKGAPIFVKLISINSSELQDSWPLLSTYYVLSVIPEGYV